MLGISVESCSNEFCKLTVCLVKNYFNLFGDISQRQMGKANALKWRDRMHKNKGKL